MESLEVDIQAGNRRNDKPVNSKNIKVEIMVLAFSALLLLLSTGLQIYLVQVKSSPTVTFFKVSLPWVFFLAASIIILSGLKILISTDGVTRELREIHESNDFDRRLNPNKYRLCSSLIKEINMLIEHVEHRNKRVDEIAEVIDLNEQENQMLWLEIEHNLCLAKEEAETDGLTQIYNRKSIEERLSREFENAINTEKPLSVLMADIDHFKQVNDTYGHKVGDEVLKIFADTLKESVRSDDIPARYGGEEFIIVLPSAPAAAAQKIAERINRSFKESVDEKLGSDYYGLECTVSIGIADYPTCAHDKNALVAAADSALYRAKEEGRNRVIYHHGDIREKTENSA